MTKRGTGSAGAKRPRRMWAEAWPRGALNQHLAGLLLTTTTPQSVAAAAGQGGARPEKRKLHRSPPLPGIQLPSSLQQTPSHHCFRRQTLGRAGEPLRWKQTGAGGAGGAVSPGEARLGPRLLHPVLRGRIAATARRSQPSQGAATASRSSSLLPPAQPWPLQQLGSRNASRRLPTVTGSPRLSTAGRRVQTSWKRAQTDWADEDGRGAV